MIRKKKVIRDIPDILIGEYVHFVEVIKDMSTTDNYEEVEDSEEDQHGHGVDEVEPDDDIIMIDVGDIHV
jgi:hypothetical protein